MTYFTAKKYINSTHPICAADNHSKCDTFSRSAEAVFELSMRFAEPFKQPENISDQERTEAERLMFLELSQGSVWRCQVPSFLTFISLLVGKLH